MCIKQSCLNAAEEFAIGILNSNSQDHIAVSSIKKPFLQGVEELAIPLYFHVGVLDDGFPYLSELYRYWKKEIGFIPRTEEDKLEKYWDRAKIFKK